MKKIVLILAGALCLGTVAVQAQDQQPAKDSTTIAPPQPPSQPSSNAVAAPAYRKDMSQIQATEVPAGVKSTLERPQFKGWENGSVYSNSDKSVFIVEVKDEVEGRLKVYRFDAEGKPITDN
ncbi:MAG: hypothetical protein ABIS36_21055 [Chryseolinea sp.]